MVTSLVTTPHSKSQQPRKGDRGVYEESDSSSAKPLIEGTKPEDGAIFLRLSRGIEAPRGGLHLKSQQSKVRRPWGEAPPGLHVHGLLGKLRMGASWFL